MNIRIEGEALAAFFNEGKLFLESLGKFLVKATKKADLEVQYAERRLPVTNEEMDTDLRLATKELEIREMRIRVEEHELHARMQAADATLKEAQVRLKVVETRHRQLDRQNTKTVNVQRNNHVGNSNSKTHGDGKPHGKPQPKKGEEKLASGSGTGDQTPPAGLDKDLTFKPFAELTKLMPEKTQTTQ